MARNKPNKQDYKFMEDWSKTMDEGGLRQNIAELTANLENAEYYGQQTQIPNWEAEIAANLAAIAKL